MRPKTARENARQNGPSDADLLKHIDGPMRSIDVAYFFGADRSEISRRLDALVNATRLARPYHGFFAPIGCTAPRPLQGRHAEVLALLSEPLTLAEVDRSIWAGYSQRRVVAGLVKAGLVVLLEDGRFVAASATPADAKRHRAPDRCSGQPVVPSPAGPEAASVETDP